MSTPTTTLPPLPPLQNQTPDLTGTTQMAPNLEAPQQQKTQWKASGLPALALGIINQVQARKHRETQQTIDHFVQNAKGLQESQGQLQQAQGMMKDALNRLQKDPNDQEARARLMQGSQMTKQARQALNTSQTNLKDMFNGPKADKHSKMISKAFGIDDKNAGTPERQAAIQAIQKQQGLDERTARLMSMLPQRQQLGPQAQQQQQLLQAGIIGKPATGGQQLRAEGQAQDRQLKAEKMANDVGLNTDKMIEKLPQLGLKEVRNDKGNVVRNPDGTIKTRNLTLDELKDNPQLAEAYQAKQAKIDLDVARAKAEPVKAAAAKLRAQKAAQEKTFTLGELQAFAAALADPTQKMTIGNVPSAKRGPVLQLMASQGKKLAIPLTGKEVDRMDLATNALHNIEKMQGILARRPDMFGPGGWGKTKFEMAVSGGDPDAIDFLAAKTLANLPAVGIHGVRGKWALEDLDKLDGNLYLNSDSMTNVLGDIHESASGFQKLANRPESISGGQRQRPANVPEGYVYKDGPKGKGWYKP